MERGDCVESPHVLWFAHFVIDRTCDEDRTRPTPQEFERVERFFFDAPSVSDRLALVPQVHRGAQQTQHKVVDEDHFVEHAISLDVCPAKTESPQSIRLSIGQAMCQYFVG